MVIRYRYSQYRTIQTNNSKGKGKGFPYSIPSVGPGAEPGVQAVSPQVAVGQPGGRLSLLSARPAVTFPAAESHRHCIKSTVLHFYAIVTTGIKMT